jgi:hypothetical protein
MKTNGCRTLDPAALKAIIEAADRAAARGAPGEALRILLTGDPGPIAGQVGMSTSRKISRSSLQSTGVSTLPDVFLTRYTLQSAPCPDSYSNL